MKKTDRMLNAIVEVNRDLDERFPVIRGKRVVVERHKIPSDAKLAEEGFEEIVNIKEVPSLGVRMRPVDDEMTEKEKELLDFMSSNRKEIREELDAKRKDLVEKGILPPLKKEKE